jgi:putative Mn2+ efflux pump MntP
MSMSALVLLAFALAMDATAVAAARGLSALEVRYRDAAVIGALFGGFQAGMPLLGWMAGAAFGPAFEAWDHWIAFVLLVGLGARMLWEARGGADDGADGPGGEPFAVRALLPLAVATSIDAAAAGVTLPLLGAPLLTSIGTIGVVTAALSAGGALLGGRIGAMAGPRLAALGGVVLIGLGTRTLFTHLAGV